MRYEISSAFENLSYEEKMWFLDFIKNRVEELKKSLIKERFEAGHCAHNNVLNTTTFADDYNIKRFVCMDCRKEFIKKDGVLLNESEAERHNSRG